MGKLIFFDINGTIIKRDSRTDISYFKANDIFLNTENTIEGIDNCARSDKQVFIDILAKYNQEFSEDKWTSFLKIYEEELKKLYPTDIWRENADAISFIEKLSKTEHKIALITGELSIGAQYKLEKLDLWKYFKTGGFGEDGLRRFDIASAALLKAKKLYGSDYDEIIVIGDTILDIKTARHIGAKIISITTGANSREELEKENPDYIIDNFKEIEKYFI